MDDLSSAIQGILGSEEGMSKLRDMAKALGLDGTAAPTPEPAPAPSGGTGLESLQALLGTAGNHTAPAAPSLPNIDIHTIAKLQQAYAAFTASDKNTDLLRAIKPHLSEKRQKRVEEAVQLMGLLRLLPMLKESGILEKLLGGGST